MPTFTVFKTETCPYCTQAKGFLDALAEARPDVRVQFVDANQNPGQFRAVARAVGRTTVPQIFLDDKYIGGWNELAGAASSGKLDAFLAGQEWKTAPTKKRWFRRKQD